MAIVYGSPDKVAMAELKSKRIEVAIEVLSILHGISGAGIYDTWKAILLGEEASLTYLKRHTPVDSFFYDCQSGTMPVTSVRNTLISEAPATVANGR